ncbi:MAG: hypothetical protein U0T73_03870 [Chitinophagales bacterium]
MKKVVVMAALVGIFRFGGHAQISKEIAGFHNPESVIGYKDHLFVSNMGDKLDPTAKDGDGYISMIYRTDGKMVQEKFIEGLNSPKGLFVCHGYLHVVDVDRIIAYKIKTKEKVWEADLSKQGITYANDVVPFCGGLLVSATDKNAIYKVKRSGKVKQWVVKGELPGANGLLRKCGKLYVANYGRGNEPDGSVVKIGCNHKVKTLPYPKGYYDGIAKICGILLVADWVNPADNSGKIMAYDCHKKAIATLPVNRTIDGPADIYADCKTKTLWIPAMREGKILAIPFAAVKAWKKQMMKK